MKLICEAIKAIKNKPKLIAFDLDSTLWQLGIDDFYYNMPYKRGDKVESDKGHKETYRVFDRDDKEMHQYPEVHAILNFIQNDLKIPMVAASRTTYPPGSKSLLNLYNWTDFFTQLEIYPGQKFQHFQNFKKQLKIEYKDMLFFDDEARNVRDLGSINVTCILIDPMKGMTWDYLKQGMEKHSNKIEADKKA